MAGARTYLARLAHFAPSYGFGFVERKIKPQPSAGAAAYLSSYFVKGRGRKVALWESVTSGAMPPSIVHVSTQLTQETRCTMRNLRLRRTLHFVWGCEFQLDEIHLVAQFLAVFGGNVQLVRVSDADRAPPSGLTGLQPEVSI